MSMASLYPNGCCSLLSDPKAFQLQPIVSDRDYLSNLPDDCLGGVFEHLNHQDLDILSCVSQKMHTFADCARHKTKKGVGNLRIFQSGTGDICVYLSTHEEYEQTKTIKKKIKKVKKSRPTYYFLCVKNKRSKEGKVVLLKYTDNDKVPPQMKERPEYGVDSPDYRTMPCIVYNRIRYLNNRFGIIDLKISDVVIDRQFLTHAGRAFYGMTTTNCDIVNIAFDDSFRQKELRMLMDCINSIKSRNYMLDSGVYNFGSLNERFLDKLNGDGYCDNLFSVFSELPSPLPVSCFGSIAKFKNIYIQSTIIEADQVMNVAFLRLQHHIRGMLEISTTSLIDRKFIHNAIQNDKRFKMIPDRLEFSTISDLKGTVQDSQSDWTATIRSGALEHRYYVCIIAKDGPKPEFEE